MPFWFVFGNHDSDTVPILMQAAIETGANCLGWGGILELAGKRFGVTHGHMTTDLRRVLAEQPDYLLSGHSHILVHPGSAYFLLAKRRNMPFLEG